MTWFEFNDGVWPCNTDHNKNICDNVWRAGPLWKLSDNSHSMEKGHNFDTRGKDTNNKTVQ